MMVLAIKWPPLRLEDILGQSQSVVSSSAYGKNFVGGAEHNLPE